MRLGKTGEVRAARAIATRAAAAILADGTKETKNFAVPGDLVLS
jgi:hypothetical protein